jgi:hypothetical protein
MSCEICDAMMVYLHDTLSPAYGLCTHVLCGAILRKVFQRKGFLNTLQALESLSETRVSPCIWSFANECYRNAPQAFSSIDWHVPKLFVAKYRCDDHKDGLDFARSWRGWIACFVHQGALLMPGKLPVNLWAWSLRVRFLDMPVRGLIVIVKEIPVQRVFVKRVPVQRVLDKHSLAQHIPRHLYGWYAIVSVENQGMQRAGDGVIAPELYVARPYLMPCSRHWVSESWYSVPPFVVWRVLPFVLHRVCVNPQALDGGPQDLRMAWGVDLMDAWEALWGPACFVWALHPTDDGSLWRSPVILVFALVDLYQGGLLAPMGCRRGFEVCVVQRTHGESSLYLAQCLFWPLFQAFAHRH